MLQIDSLNKTFGSIRALDDLSFHVNPGEIFGFVGSNGAGKTTAMRIMLGVMAADSGQVSWNGSLIDLPMRRRIGYMPEERGLYPRMQVGKQLVYLAQLHGLSASEATAAMEHWTDRLNVAARREDNVQTLSLGNQQRVQLGAALVHNPDLLVLDEPFSGLDPVAVDIMSSVIRDKAESGASVIFSSHQLDLVERLCDRVGIVSQGSMVAMGTIHELRSTGRPQLALAVGAPRQALVDSLAAAGFTAQDDPLEGTSDAPHEEGLARVVVDLDGVTDDQAILRAALSTGPVREFAPRRPHLTELFKDVVVTAPAEKPAPKKKGLFGRKKAVK
ncbi:MAG: ATP-binding cassette domain-containing protein [Actinomycetaceae bacterium]|nr:ATP-binding cassette domain-containing protein [Actinomycetaceae bacterium]